MTLCHITLWYSMGTRQSVRRHIPIYTRDSLRQWGRMENDIGQTICSFWSKETTGNYNGVVGFFGWTRVGSDVVLRSVHNYAWWCQEDSTCCSTRSICISFPVLVPPAVLLPVLLLVLLLVLPGTLFHWWFVGWGQFHSNDTSTTWIIILYDYPICERWLVGHSHTPGKNLSFPMQSNRNQQIQCPSHNKPSYYYFSLSFHNDSRKWQKMEAADFYRFFLWQIQLQGKKK